MIYVHVPFCRSFCTYCDFYSEIACRGSDDRFFADYLRSLSDEIYRRREELDSSRDPDTLYFGGGTPSVLPLDIISKIVRALPQRSFREFTFEANPDDIVQKGEEYVRGLMALGVNRFSMGVQSLSDPVLKWMRRRHDADAARRAFGILRECGAENISVDVIFGISLLSAEELKTTLDEILSWKPEHISAYQLSVEEGGELASMIEKGQYSEADEDFCREQYELICSKLRSGGYRHYEISSWARPGYESVHNSAYWSRRPYVGLGPGAHSLQVNGSLQRRVWNSQSLKDWKQEGETLTEDQIKEEELMLGLRRERGVDISLADGSLRHYEIAEKDWFVSDDIITSLANEIL
ncbi:MAG: radical SAM family heme chaperone HemW [Bacteroidales bacterium]|nr:radical SAM family heme chaperone HemW [Bacteroidales bacterium]